MQRVEGTAKRRSLRRKRGQAISEYAMMLAFVAVIVAFFFAFAPGSMREAISHAFSRITKELNNMSSFIDSAGSFIALWQSGPLL